MDNSEKERAALMEALKKHALGLMNGDNEQAEIWLNTELNILGNKTPISYVLSEQQLDDIEMLIGRLKHGVFS